MKTALSEGASLSHRYLQFMVAAGLVLLISGCKKDKENSAVVEEVPAAAAPKETDTSATLAEEPNLQQVGKDKPGSAKNTFHPGKGKDKHAGAPSAAASEAGFSDAGHFVVQVAIFKSKKQAASLVEKLSGQGYPAYVAEVTDPVPQLSGTYHRVRIGKFLKIADAKAFGDNTLKPLGYDYWVDNKKNDGIGGMGGGSAPAAESAPASEAPSAEAPAPRKGKKAKAAAVAEPAEPPSGTWGAPSATEPSEPKAPEPPVSSTGDSWGNSKAETPAAKPAASSELPGTNPAPATPSPAASAPSSSSAPSTAPAQPAKADSGKVNLDEW